MAIIKCPECKKNISDKAESCPHCGYELKQKSVSNTVNKTIDQLKKNNYTKFIPILLLVVIGFLIYNSTAGKKNDNPTPQTNNGNYVFNQGGLYFEFPTDCKTYVDKTNTIYVGKNIDNQGALIPYIMIEKYKNYTNPQDILNDLTNEIGKEYSDATITINMLSNYVGDKYVYGIQYMYTSSGHVVVDNRYAFLVNNKMYLVTTKEENTNTNEINNIAGLIIQTLKEE